MKTNVVVKSYPNGINLRLNGDVEFDLILDEIRDKFAETKNFFARSKMALSYEGRILTEEEEMRILETLDQVGVTNVVCIVGHNEETDNNYIKALDQVERRLAASEDGKLYKGSLTNGEVLETETNVVILGDVYPGCAVIAKGNIVVLGGLYGEAYAGGENANRFVAALAMEAERIRIGNLTYKPAKQPKWGIKPKVSPRMAYVKGGKIVFEPMTRELFRSF